MKRLLHALSVSLRCLERGFCTALLSPDVPVHVIGCNRPAEWIAKALLDAAYSESKTVDAALYDDVLTETGSGLLRRELGE